MFIKGLYSKNTSKDNIKILMEQEGFKPKLITEKPNFIYETHQHPETKLIVCLEGSMKVKVKDFEYNFEPGDKLLIPGNTLHSGIVSPKGCIYYWSERLLK